MNRKILIVAGDPRSINSEIILKSWNKLNNQIKKNVYLIANYNLISQQLKKLRFKTNIIKITQTNNSIYSKKLKIIDVPLRFKNPFKVPYNHSSKYVKKSLSLAHKLTIDGKAKSIINCPIDKKLLSKTEKIGVTEFLASKCNIYDDSEIMMIYNPKLSVVPLTTHLNLKDVSKKINQKLIIKKNLILNKNYKKIFKKKPRIGILGFNPHNAELRKNSEEVLQIIPAIKKLKKKRIKY